MGKRFIKGFLILCLLTLFTVFSGCGLFEEEETVYSYNDYSASIEVKTLD